MNGKILFLSMIISILIIASMNSSLLTRNETINPDSSSAQLQGYAEGNILSIAANNITIFFILTVVVYFVMRSISGSFGRFSK